MIDPKLHLAVLKALEVETNRIVEEEANAAAARVRERIRLLAGQVATKVSSYVSYETMQGNLVITVKLPEANETAKT